MSYSLAMIVRNCAEELERCLASFARFPDEVVVVNTGLNDQEEGFVATNEMAKKYGAKVFHFPWVADFSKARNFSFECCSHDMVMWLDSDDTVHNAEDVDREVRAIIEAGYTMIFMDYLYEWQGEPMQSEPSTVLVRERIVDRRIFEWRAPIHECLCAMHEPKGIRLSPNVGAVVHDMAKGDPRKEGHLERNLRVLETNFPDGECELRMQFYWANTLMGLKRYAEAAEIYKKYIAESDNQHERIIARNAVSECYRMQHEFKEAMRWAHGSILEDDSLPTGWLHAAEAANLLADYGRAVRYSENALDRLGNRDFEMVTNPSAGKARPTFIRAHALLRLHRYAECAEAINEARQYNRHDPDVMGLLGEMQNTIEKSRLHGSLKMILDHAHQNHGLPVATGLAEALPVDLKDTALAHHFVPKDRPQDQPSIAFFCGEGTADKWGPESIAEGIGGSEEAVINMAREFDERGWHVEVYCRRDEYAQYGRSQHWYPASQWTGENDNPLDVVIWWRAPEMIRRVNARAAYLWMHDVQEQTRWPFGSWDEITGVFALSSFHASMVPWVPSEKVVVTGNGTDPGLWAEPSNEPHRLIYGSCPSRGLVHVLRLWPSIRKAHPDAELDVFYGWSPTYHSMMPGSKFLTDTYEEVEELRKQDGINWHGKVGQEELNRAFARAGIWVYPTEFPEISCITAMKAQIHGAIPVCTDDFALKTTVQHGKKVPGPMSELPRLTEWLNELLTLMASPTLQSDIRKKMIPWARQEYTWKRIADQWESLFVRDGACPRKESEALHLTA